jgi:hypothetical protein
VKKAMLTKKKQNRLLLLDDYIKKSIFVFAILRSISIFNRIPPNLLIAWLLILQDRK